MYSLGILFSHLNSGGLEKGLHVHSSGTCQGNLKFDYANKFSQYDDNELQFMCTINVEDDVKQQITL